MPTGDQPLIPTLFPTTPQTSEAFVRLEPVDLSIQLRIIESHVSRVLPELRSLIARIGELNQKIVHGDLTGADATLLQIAQEFGHSHLLLRKAALVRVLGSDESLHPTASAILNDAGLPKNNVIALSLADCFQEEKDFLSLKRSIMNLPDRGAGNRFTRDLSRIPFHPFSRDADDLRDQLQSSLQSSLIDSLVTLKTNQHLVNVEALPSLAVSLELLELAAPELNDIAALQATEGSEDEHVFYKRSSGWLESSEICRYRRLVDHFYDSPEAHYFKVTPDLVEALRDSVDCADLNELHTASRLTKHQSMRLAEMQRQGTVTRSALFNYLLHASEGFLSVEEAALIDLMGVTRDLSRTIPIPYATNLAKSTGSDVAKLILYLLIAKRSRNERDDHLLRKAVQRITTQDFGGELLALVESLATRSSAVAIYAYEVFTEDFIARLYDLIDSPSDVIDARASLHRWMGHHTGDRAYTDRARTLLIDHQINKVRNEIDDNRIYVDVARFQEWMSEELLRELDTALGSIDRSTQTFDSTDSVLSVLIEQCYATFCAHKAFGIASYLGRRIRHGTFKGHLYASVVGIEREERFSELLQDSQVSTLWFAWKLAYESRVDEIIRERLHVASPTKREGLMKPSLLSPQKTEIILACGRALLKEYSETKTSSAAAVLITEYCWRLAEVDLLAFNAYLKSQQRNLVEADTLKTLQALAPPEYRQDAADLSRAVSRAISEKLLAMRTWFKRPLNVAPKASLPLLYKAVVEEVRTTYPALKAPLEMNPSSDIELFGGAYHVLYDSFYVVVYNAAKHGKMGGLVEPEFSIARDASTGQQFVRIEISSEIQDEDVESEIAMRLRVGTAEDVANAQVYENRSGIPKLYQLQAADSNFSILRLDCSARRVTVVMAYRLEH